MFKQLGVIAFLSVFMLSSFAMAQTPSSALPEKVQCVKYVTCTTCGDKDAPAKATIFEGKVYSFCNEKCLQDFAKDPKKIVGQLKDVQTSELTTSNEKGKCFACAKPAVVVHFKTTENKIAFFCSAECMDKTKEDHSGHDHEKNPHKDAPASATHAPKDDHSGHNH